jgi:hypothetical protein
LHFAIRGGVKSRIGRQKSVQTAGTADAHPARMLDLILILAAVAFFGVSWAYVLFCERLGGAP